ncbi:MAG: tetratricopeptide repeat protein [Pseudanabaenaceae cyanobacterium SKYGB_i_bin29]|nr:tetratricopeptide repeat protein [Pseudanabaenaceae cyanobacterium SKYG29]MDW8420793.1 tetratricopeptide repeat protein [Pseudanabaenaceae cyanobacterium SKYGB_i_bin29]
MSYLDRAHQLLAEGNLEAAFSYARRALEIDPNCAPALLAMGKILEQNHQLDDALTCYQEAYRLDSTLWESLWRSGIIYDRKGLAELALQTWQTVMTAVPEQFSPPEHLKLAKLLLARNNPQAAIKATEFCADLPEAWQLRAQAYLLLEDLESAHNSLTHARHLDPSFNLATEYTNLAKLALKYNRISQGQTYLETAIAMQSDYLEAHFYFALTFAKLGQLKEALLAFQELLSLDKNYAPAYYEMGILATQLGKWTEADAFFTAGRTLNPHIYPQVQPLIDRVKQALGDGN